MARDFYCGLKIAVYARTVYVRRVVEREGVIKFPPALSRNASVQAATSSHFRHIGPRSGWVGYLRLMGEKDRNTCITSSTGMVQKNPPQIQRDLPSKSRF